jgi:tetratricopeptide (TPR) repeat protein
VIEVRKEETMKKGITIIVILVCLMVAFSALVFGQVQTAQDLKNLNAHLKQLYRQGNYKDAIPFAQRIVFLTEKKYGSDNVETANALNNLALIYIIKERYTEAESLSKKALKIYEAQLGKDQLCVAVLYDHLEEIFKKTRRLAEMNQAHDKAAEIRKKSKGDKLTCGILDPLEVMGPVKGNGEGKLPEVEPESAFWNTWFENWENGKRAKELKTGKRVEELKTGNKYFIVLDISRLSYFKDYAVAVGSRVQGAIEEARSHREPTIQFTIRPILHGNLLRLTDNHPTSITLNVDIKKLLKPKDSSSNEEIEQKEDDWKAGKIELYDFASVVQAGEVAFEVLAKKPGDATISVSIWDKSGMIPLDHLTLSVRVIDEKAKRMERDPASQTVPLKAGLGTLLDVSFDFSSTGPLVANAAFYIFEPGPEGKSIILFAARKNKEEKEASDRDQGVSVYAWETKILLSDYIERKEGFLVKINNARKRATEKEKYTYQEAASELREMIFTGTNDTSKEAEEAEKVFRDIVQKNNLNPIVFVRMRNEKGDPVYLPLGILAAQSENSILDKRIVLVQPLPRERYPAGKEPVEGWTFGLPEKLDNLTSQIDNALKGLEITADPRFHRNIKGLRDYFETISGLASDKKPEGILILAHHEGGYLWFTEVGNRITIPQIKHRFPPGSIAILSACSVAAATGNNQDILKSLNEQGIDAMIISPFPVDANYGTMLAVHVIKTLGEAKAKKKEITMAELFSAATVKTKEYFKNIMGINFDDMDLEFLIAGDYRIRIVP